MFQLIDKADSDPLQGLPTKPIERWRRMRAQYSSFSGLEHQIN
jgi:hypothetical protein